MYDFFIFLKALVYILIAIGILYFLVVLVAFFKAFLKKDLNSFKEELLNIDLRWLYSLYEWIEIIFSTIVKFIIEIIIFGAVVGIIIFGWKQLI